METRLRGRTSAIGALLGAILVAGTTMAPVADRWSTVALAAPPPPAAPRLASAWVHSPGALPVTAEYAPVQMAPVDGGVYVLVSSAGPVSRSILARLDTRGRPGAGWPLVSGGGCANPWGTWGWDPSPDLLVAPDGSVRVVCGDGRVFAFDLHARLLPGWPVQLENLVADEAPRMVGSRFVALATESGKDPPYPARYWIQSVSADGRVSVGRRLEIPDTTGFPLHALGADGLAYFAVDARTSQEVTAIDLNGVRPGWPVTVRYPVMGFVFGPPGLAYLVAQRGGGAKTQLRALTSSGRAVMTSAAILPVEWLSTWDGAGSGEPAALAAIDRTAWVFGTRRGDPSEVGTGGAKTLVYALDSAGRIRRGWPLDVSPGLVPRGSCDAVMVTGCGFWYSRPAIGPGDVLYLTREAASGTSGGSILAIGIDGKTRPGWPVALRRAGAWFEPIEVGSDGTVYALAHETEARGLSATIVAIAPDGTVRWTRTVVEP